MEEEYRKILFENLEILLPGFDNQLTQLSAMWYHCFLQIAA